MFFLNSRDERLFFFFFLLQWFDNFASLLTARRSTRHPQIGDIISNIRSKRMSVKAQGGRGVRQDGYPVYVIQSSDSNGTADASPSETDSLAEIQAIIYNPTFLVLQKFIMPPRPPQPGDRGDMLASPMVTWLYTTGNGLDLIARTPNLPLDFTKFVSQQPDVIKTIQETMTLPNGMVLRDPFPIPFSTTAEFVPAGRLLLDICQGTFCCTLKGLYTTCLAQYPGSVVRLPIYKIRVRDVVMYRHFKAKLAEVGMSAIQVCTDNVQRPQSKEKITQPLVTFCAQCMKLDFTHQRCSGCAVSSIPHTRPLRCNYARPAC